MRAGDFGYGSTLAVATFLCVASHRPALRPRAPGDAGEAPPSPSSSSSVRSSGWRSPRSGPRPSSPGRLPEALTVASYAGLGGSFARAMRELLVVAALTTAVCLAVGSAAAFAIARLPRSGKGRDCSPSPSPSPCSRPSPPSARSTSSLRAVGLRDTPARARPALHHLRAPARALAADLLLPRAPRRAVPRRPRRRLHALAGVPARLPPALRCPHSPPPRSWSSSSPGTSCSMR